MFTLRFDMRAPAFGADPAWVELGEHLLRDARSYAAWNTDEVVLPNAFGASASGAGTVDELLSNRNR